ncbi:DUF4349 domain-containing protein [Butyrivibrio sp. DSM 10294]|uniref:DUF4349 domain-containing protein n=1 Tax=Butyrivibrio sp. DSM 10294 TaxID=2972457 RepID=UPI00234E6204|nr:DUF4349 domain-containing protein [Butyrivibrio sp. DSM 10294]MDC7292205.1 DUF4349 domain-containing protein [Butyrivibrio sp. DSM 10294]
MKRKGNLGIAIGTSLLAATLLAGCGSSGSRATTDNAFTTSKMTYEAPAGAAIYEEAADEAYMDDQSYNTSGSQAETVNESAAKTNRKLITTININAETEDFDKARNLVENKITELGGYIENSSVYNEDRSANYTIRIPADNADKLIETLEGNNNVTSKSVSVEDVTLQYADTESRKKALKTEEERLLKIMESAETVEDLIAVESRLAEVRYELESIESQLRTYDNKIDYTTVYLYLEEVEKFTPVEKESAGHRMADGFVESIISIRDGLVEFCIWFVIHIPQILLFAIFVAAVVIIVRVLDKKSKKKKVAKNTQQNVTSAEGENGK